MVKVTFTLDETTVDKLNQTAARLAKPKSEVVREAIAEFHARRDRLSEAERLEKLRIIAEIKKRPPTRPQNEVDRELRELRESRRRGWSRSSDRAS